MIKCKEDLLNTYIDNSEEELLGEYLKVCKLHDISWRSGAIASEFLPKLKFTTIEGGVLVQTEWTPKGKRLTLEDFEGSSAPNLEGHVTMDELQEILHGGEDEESSEPVSVIFAPENKPQQDKNLVSKYRYTPLEVESVFDLKEHLEKGNLFWGNPRHMEKIINERALMKVIVEGGDRLYLREEVTWQDEVVDYLNEKEMSSFNSSIWEDRRELFQDEVFLEAARIALRATGEFK